MLSSMSAAAVTKCFFYISKTIRASDFKSFHNVALDSLYISTGNDIIIYFRSEANRTNVYISVKFGSRFLDKVSTDSENFYRFGNCGSSASFALL